MSVVSPGSPGTPNDGEPPRLPLRWAVIIGLTAAGIACFSAGGVVAADAGAAAVAVALLDLLT